MIFKIGGKEFEVSNEDITKSIEEAKTEITIESDFLIRNKDEEFQFVANMKKDARIEGVEIAVKQTREKLGLDFTGRSMEALLTAHESKIVSESTIEPDKKNAQLLSDVDLLKKSINTLTEEKQGIESMFSDYKKKDVILKSIESSLPKNLVIPQEDMINLINSKIKFDVEEGVVVSRNFDGSIKKNSTTLDPLNPKSVIDSFFNENPHYLTGAGGGAGGGDSAQKGGIKTMDQFIEDSEKEGKNISSPEFIKEVEAGIANKTIVG
jgi:hypothetical protein